MRHARFLVLLAIILCTCCNCVHESATRTRAASADEIEVMRQETVGVVVAQRIVCSGVWVSTTSFLTAAHCTEPDMAGEDGLFGFVTYDGVLASGETSDFTVQFATLKARDPIADLALLTIDYSIAPHPFARLGSHLETGDMVSIVGHSSGLLWSYTPGFVSGYRSMRGPDGIKGDFLQLWGAIAGGNSGGGAWDADGRLVGICSFGTKVITMFVSRPAIGAFMAAHAS